VLEALTTGFDVSQLDGKTDKTSRSCPEKLKGGVDLHHPASLGVQIELAWQVPQRWDELSIVEAASRYQSLNRGSESSKLCLKIPQRHEIILISSLFFVQPVKPEWSHLEQPRPCAASELDGKRFHLLSGDTLILAVFGS
jgi:hypothetical protein